MEDRPVQEGYHRPARKKKRAGLPAFFLAVIVLALLAAALLRIFSCAYAYRATGDRKYLEHAENDINTVCSFADWNGQRHFLDVGEMAAAVALGYDWLYADLKPETRANAERALREYAFTAAGQYGANFYKASNNWNQVCNAGLVCAALAIYETRDDPSHHRKIVGIEPHGRQKHLFTRRKLHRRLRLLGIRFGIRGTDAYGARNSRRVR